MDTSGYRGLASAVINSAVRDLSSRNYFHIESALRFLKSPRDLSCWCRWLDMAPSRIVQRVQLRMARAEVRAAALREAAQARAAVKWAARKRRLGRAS